MTTLPFLLLLATTALPSLAGSADDADDDADEEADEEEWDITVPYGPVHDVTLSLDEGTWMSVDQHGDTVVFDLLGDIWSMPAQGGMATRLTSGPAWDSDPRIGPDGGRIAYSSDADGNRNIWLMAIDGAEPEQLTKEEEARVTDPVWDPAGDWLIVRRRTIDTRSIGVTELWQVHLDGGKGFPLTKKDAHPHAADAVTDGRYIWFSTRFGRFDYGKDPVAGLWEIQRLDRRDGTLRPVATGAGSAARPILSPDGKQLAFISRDRTDTLLEVMELATGKRRILADWLDHDQLEGFALQGTYPTMHWGPDGLLLWADGKLWRVDPVSGVRKGVPFRAEGSWTLHDVPRPDVKLDPTVQARVIRWPVWNQAGDVAFSAFGLLWLRTADGELRRVGDAPTGYSPAWSPDGASLAWTSWSDTDGGRLHITRDPAGKAKTETLPVQGQLVSPAWSPDGASLVVLRGVGGNSSTDLGSEPWFELLSLQRPGNRKKGSWNATVIADLDSRGANSRAPRLTVYDGRVWYLEGRETEPLAPEETVFLSRKLDGTDLRTHLVFAGAQEILPSPDMKHIAYKIDHQAWVSVLPAWGGGEVAVADALPAVELTEDVGDWLSWSPDSKQLSWAEGPVLKRLALPSLKEEAELPDPTELELAVFMPRAAPAGSLALTHARVLTMADREQPDTVIDDATVVIEGDRIVSVTAGGPVPEGARIVDCSGKTVIPGLIDVHAHLHYTAGDILPEQEWRYAVSLDFGVTTVHDPSANTDLVFTQAERVAAGLMEGPRVLSTGFVLYGALSNQGAKTPDKDAALHHLRRLQTVGAGSAKIYQQSGRDQRQWYAAACAELGMLCVAEGGGDLWMNMTMAVDGYQAIEHSLPMAPLYADIEGLFSASHSPATDDRPASAGTAYTPTLLVAYGGRAGESYFFQSDDPLAHDRLLRNFPRRQLDARAWRHDAFGRDGDWHHQDIAVDAATMARAGLLVTLGAHGQLQGLGVHWELHALAGPGAMTPAEAIRAGTIDGARYLGMQQELGSIEAGKLADLVILDADPLADIKASTDIHAVVHGGTLRE